MAGKVIYALVYTCGAGALCSTPFTWRQESTTLTGGLLVTRVTAKWTLQQYATW